MTKFSALCEAWLEDEEFQAEYEAQEREFAIADNVRRTMREARERAGLTQADLAKRLHTTEEAVQRLEQGGQELTLSALLSFADGIGSTLLIEFRTPEGEHP